MNRLVCTNLDAATPASQAALPPAHGASSPAARSPQPARILFINGQELGFGTTGRNLQHYTAQRDDIEAVHFSVVMPKWLRLVCADCPSRRLKHAGLDFGGVRQ